MIRNIIIIIFIFFAALPPVLAADDMQNWDKFLYNTDTSGLQKPITQKEYSEALDIIKNNGKKPNKKNKPSEDDHGKNDLPLLNVNEDLILRLPYEAIYQDIILPTGFYKIKAYYDDIYSHIGFLQGTKPLVKIKAAKVKPLFCPDKVSCIKVEPVDNKYLKVYYKDLNIALIGYLYLKK